MAVHSANPGNIFYQECPYCKRIIVGIGPLAKHMRACKKKLCAQCTNPFEMCKGDGSPTDAKFWACDCGRRFKDVKE